MYYSKLAKQMGWKIGPDKRSIWIFTHDTLANYLHNEEGEESAYIIQGWFAKHLGELKEFIDKNEVPS